jgi:beta-galactosidase
MPINKFVRSSLILLALVPACCPASDQPSSPPPAATSHGREYVSLDLGWHFRMGDPPTAMEPGFDDSGWRTVNVPHDWSIEGPFEPRWSSGNGFAPGGIAWYRRHFHLGMADTGKVVTAEFDGVYDNCEVWLNGFLVGGRPYGFESFTCDLTPVVRFGDTDNVLTVRVDHSRDADSRWYTGSGIYRHVRLCVANPLHVAQWGTAVTTPVVTTDTASIHIETKVQNASNEPRSFSLVSEVDDPSGQIAGTSTTQATVDALSEATLAQDVHVAKPQLWSTEKPQLYRLRSSLAGSSGGDALSTAFGIRTLGFDPNTGFSLNGVPTKLKGVCVHQDGGSVGVAIPARVWERRLLALRALGVNAIRTSHNPPAPEFLDLCDQMGFLVMDEAFDEYTPGKSKWIVGWTIGVPGHFGYSEHFEDWSVRDIRDIVLRDRNHPSIIMWSIGNEIDGANDPFTDPVLGKDYHPGNPPATDMVKWGKPLVEAVKQLDRTRPVTAALAGVKMSNAVGYAQLLDLAGYNYQEYRYASDHQKYPERFIYGSENSHTYEAWVATRDNPAISGQFLWTGIDYLGEARPWPARANPDGLLDLCGFVKPLGRFRQSLWSQQPMVYLCAEETGKGQGAAGDTNKPVGKETWNWPDRTPLSVSCYTNCPEVTLFLNGMPVGTQRSIDARDGFLSWKLPFSPGVLKAVGKKDGHEVCAFELRTAGAPDRIELHADAPQLSANGQDVAQVEFDVVDQAGVRIPGADSEISFELNGPSEILGIGNGDVSNSEPVTAPTHRAFEGRGLVIIQTTAGTGAISLRASAAGLQSTTITLAGR